MGGQLNAFTTKESTCFYAKVLDEHLPIAFDVLADMLMEPTFKPEHIEMERGVILEEIAMYEDTPDEQVHDLLLEACWADHPLGRSVLGERDTITAIGRNQILDYYSATYAPDNAVLAVAGNTTHEQVIELVHRYFGDWKPTGRRPRTFDPPVTRLERKVKTKQTEQVHICLGAPGFPVEHPESYVLHVISSALGGGASSRLFQEIREEKGLAYSIYSYQASFSDAGLFGVYAGVSPKNAAYVVELVLKHLRTIASDGISWEELRHAKSQAKGSVVLALESTSSRMIRLGRSELALGRVVGIEEVIRRLESVTLEDVRRVAGMLFGNGRLALAAIGPVDGNGGEGGI
ncbi:MAG: M16 family metallopeptidase [Bacillota bacterium]